MRNIVLARVDDRLIHGEVVTAWTPSLSANRIVIVDDTVAADKFNKRILMSLAPQGTKVAVLTVAGATKALQKPDPGGERVIVLTKSPIVFEQLINGGVDIKAVNLGGMGIRGDRKPFINNVSASPEEVDSIRRMKEKGVNVYYQLVPEQKVVDISNLL
jgi:mannose/fructose/N-acetylgalactosamine-specific phosphotransferase system component IIB